MLTGPAGEKIHTVLSADGRIQPRGTDITSHSSTMQRMMGTSVHVN